MASGRLRLQSRHQRHPETPAIRICRDLLEEGAQLAIFDPKVSAKQIAG